MKRWGRPIENPKIRCYTKLHRFYDPEGSIYTLLRRGLQLAVVLLEREKRYRGCLIVEGAELLKEGRKLILFLLTGAEKVQPLTPENTCIGVGDGDDPLIPAQQGLTGKNKMYKLVDAGFPLIREDSLVVRATFAPSEANFEWRERTVANGPGDEYVNLDRMLLPFGRKPVDETWCIEVEYELGWRR